MPDGAFWIARTGAPRRDLPWEFGKWGSVYRQSRRWTLAGLWQTIHQVLNDSEAGADLQHRNDLGVEHDGQGIGFVMRCFTKSPIR